MSLVLRTGGVSVIALWWWEPPAEGARLSFTSRAEARAFLARLRAEPDGARRLRRLLASRRGAAPSRLEDGEVAEQLAHLLEAGQLRLTAAPRLPLTGRDKGEEAASEPPPPAAAPRSAPEASKPVATTFEDTIDAEVLAAALKQAAADGVPFCEECYKASVRKQREAAAKARPSRSPPPAEETFSKDVDAVAMAAAMREAAQQGVPFCEECHKAKLAEQRARAAKKAPGPAAPASASAPNAAPAAAPPPVATLPEDMDAALMAEAMKAAAREGVPFCEVCMKKELEAKRAARSKASAKAGASTSADAGASGSAKGAGR